MDGTVPGFKAAMPVAALAYQAFEEQFATPRWQGLAAVGAMVQRPLGSTSTDPSLPDVYYVEAAGGRPP
ncbi:MAG: hypothetical protein IPG75_15095 [Gemmatimonadetes bacterium]|nr:hypothetical protein [Gemmatimonadota bacterium]